mmetsp:Transcript_16003/g.1427  ORF Transcript_16003/g.1427 Transcript_16003/m.1427 type:complete len:100 (-) Transcript_16003:147-446(-)
MFVSFSYNFFLAKKEKIFFKFIIFLTYHPPIFTQQYFFHLFFYIKHYYLLGHFPLFISKVFIEIIIINFNFNFIQRHFKFLIIPVKINLIYFYEIHQYP